MLRSRKRRLGADSPPKNKNNPLEIKLTADFFSRINQNLCETIDVLIKKANLLGVCFRVLRKLRDFYR